MPDKDTKKDDVKLDEQILAKMSEVGDQIKAVQETNDRLQESYDGLDVQTIKEQSEKAATALEAIQKEKQEMAALEVKERFDALELALARQGDGTKEDPEKQRKYKDGMTRYMRKGVLLDDEVVDMVCDAQVKQSLFGVDDADLAYHKKDLIAASGPDGGYFILPDRANTIIQRIFETSPIRPVANIVTTTSDIWEIPIDDGEFSSGWVGEVEARPDTNTSEVGLIKIPVHEGYAMPRATQKMLDDAGFDVESWINGKVSRKLGRQENTSFVSGNGSKKPKGFLTYPAWAAAGVYERDAVEQVTATGTSGSLDQPNDLIELQNSMIEDYQAGAAWGMNRRTFTDIMQMRSTATGDYLLNPMMLKEGTDKILLGKNVIFMSDMPVVAATALAVIYADWSEFYTIVDRPGIRVLRDPYTAKPYVRFYTTKRVGGAVTNYEAGKILVIN